MAAAATPASSIATALADRVLAVPAGRASQMNAGAAACDSDLLLFLHADTALPERADELVRQALADRCAWGRFDVRLDSSRTHCCARSPAR